jgi:hypothetical protein
MILGVRKAKSVLIPGMWNLVMRTEKALSMIQNGAKYTNSADKRPLRWHIRGMLQ